MSGVRFPHLQRRNGIYHLRMRVPDRLRLRIERSEVSKSLGTYSSILAQRFAAKISGRLQEVFVVIEQDVYISPKEARKLVRTCFSDIQLLADQTGPFLPRTDWPDLERREQIGFSRDRISCLENQVELNDFEKSISKLADQYLDRHGAQFKGLSKEGQMRLLNGFARVLIENERYFIERVRDPLSEYQPKDSLFNHVNGDVTHSGSCSKHKNEAAGPKVGQAVASYLAVKESSWIAKTHKARTWQLGYLQEFLGSDTSLNSVTSSQIRDFRDKLLMLRKKHGQGKSLSFFEKLTSNKFARIKNKTARLIYEPAKAFFRWAKSEEGLIAINPADDVKWITEKLPKGLKTRRPFVEKELLTLFQSPMFIGCKSKGRRFEPGKEIYKDAQYWIPILGYYTGARLGELVQLHVSDVKFESGTSHLDINEKSGSGDKKHVKTEAGVRQIPLHQDLIDLGFLDFVKRRQHWKHSSRRLFSEVKFGVDGQASTEFSKKFTRIMDRVGLKDPALTFHSFRHGAEDAFRNASQPQYLIDAVMGHSDGKVSSIYGVGPNIELKAEAISAMKVPISLPNILSE